MFDKFFPSAYAKSVFHIDYKNLYAMGIRGIIFDVDNTLVHHGDDATKEIERFLEDIHDMNFKTVLLSDNSEERVKRFVRNIDTAYVYDAKKPATDGYEKAVSLMGIGKDETIMVGDQMFVDIIGANTYGIRSVLVSPIKTHRIEWCGFKRIIEKVILMFFYISNAGREGKKYVC